MDANRLTVDRGLLHHAVTPLWSNRSKKELAQWFSDNGFARAYGSNPANWSGLINPFTGGRSYSQTHAVGQRVDNTTPDATAAERAAGYRVFYIVSNPKGVITWHAGNWNVNQRSIAIENLGDYRNYALRNGDCKVIADFFRPLDKAVNGAMHILLHNQVYATACPARIGESQQKIIDYINNPPATPKPTPTPTPTSNVKEYKALTKASYEFVRDAKLWNFNADSQAKMKAEKSFKKGERLDIVGKAVYKTGSEYMMTAYSFGDAAKTGKPAHTTGINSADLKKYVAPKPVVTTKEERETEAVPYTTKTNEDATLDKGTRVLSVVGKNGVRTIVYTVTYTDGKETARAVKSNTVTTAPVTEEVIVGTRVDTPKDSEQDARLSALEAFAEQVKELISKIAEAFNNWRKK